MQWNRTYQESVFSFANNINTHEGGSHLSGFRSALTRTLNKYARDKGFLKEKDKNLEGEDIREGLTAVISAKLTDPQFEGQTKTKLGNPGMQGFVESVVNAKLAEFLEENPQEAKVILQKAVSAAQARAAARKARDATRKSAMGGMGLPGKLADCMVKEPEISEIFIVEGDSAGGSAKQGRDRSTQAVLPLRGKILNVEKSRIDKVLQNAEIQALITALGTGIRDEFDIEKLRYHKIILMTDADVDGAHIRTLILTLLFREMQELVDAGHIYIAKPPLYRVTQGKRDQYIEKESELENILLGDKLERFEIADHTGKPFKLTDVRWQRYCRLLKQYEGWSGALRADHGHEVVQFLEESQILDYQIKTADELLEMLKRDAPDTEPHIMLFVDADEDVIRVKATERRSNLARTHRLRRSIFEAKEYRQLARVHADLVNTAGTPPFTIKLGDETEDAASFEELRRGVLAVAGKGVKLQRFKGLGEMNAEQLRGDHDGPDHAHLGAGHDGRRGRGRPALHHAHGREGRTATRVHRGERPRRNPGYLRRCSPSTPPRSSDLKSAEMSTSIMSGNVEPRGLEEEMRSSYLDYAMSVIVGRALPDVRDGLKPVHRRVLFSMNENGLQPNRPVRQGRAHRRRRHGQVPPARRLRDLRHARPDGAGLLPALPARRRPGQLRLDRRGPRGRHAVHGGPPGPDRARDAARPGLRHGRLRAQLRRPGARAARPAGALPEPAGQRLQRHRRRHGDEHPAAQPQGDDRRHDRLHREPGHRRRRA